MDCTPKMWSQTVKQCMLVKVVHVSASKCFWIRNPIHLDSGSFWRQPGLARAANWDKSAGQLPSLHVNNCEAKFLKPRGGGARSKAGGLSLYAMSRRAKRLAFGTSLRQTGLKSPLLCINRPLLSETQWLVGRSTPPH